MAAATLDWTEIDDQAVDTVRVLAMDAVQKVGNGHPGTAMSLAPGGVPAVPEGDAAQPRRPALARPRPLRAVLRALQPHPLHPALPRRLGPRARGPQVAAHLGQQDPGPPGVRPHRRRRDHHRPARARASATRSAWRWPPAASAACSTPTRPRATRRSTTTIYALCSDGDIEEGVSAEASAIAGVQQLGNLTLIYDDNRISIEDDTDIALSEDVAAALRGLRLARPARRLDPRRHGSTPRTSPRCTPRSARPRRVTDQPSFIVLRTIIAWPAPNAQNTGKAHGSALGDGRGRRHQEDPRLRPRPDLRGPDRRPRAHPPGWSSAARPRRRAWDERRSTAWATKPSGRHGALRPAADAHPARRAGPTTCRRSTADEKGMATRKASGAVINAIAGGRARAVGRLGRPRRSPTTPPSRAPRRSCPRTASTKMWKGDPLAGRVLHFGIREHGMGAIMNGIAVHGGTRVFGGTFLTFSDYMRGVGAAGRADGAAGHLRLDPRLDRPRRGRPDPPADRAPRRAARDPRPRRRTPGRRQRDRRLLAGRSSSTPTGPAGLVLTRQNVPVFPRGEDGFTDTSNVAPRRLRAARRRRRHARRRARSAPAPRSSWPSQARDAARREGRPRPRRLDAVPGVVRRAGGVLPRDGDPADRQGPGLGRGRHRPGLARGRRRPRPDRLARALRRLGRLRADLPASSASPPRPSPTRPRTASASPPADDRAPARHPVHQEEAHVRPPAGSSPTPESPSGSTTCPASASRPATSPTSSRTTTSSA